MAVTDLNYLKANLDLANNTIATPEQQKRIDERLTRILDAAEEVVQRETGLSLTPREATVLVSAYEYAETDKPILIPINCLKNPINSLTDALGTVIPDINSFAYWEDENTLSLDQAFSAKWKANNDGFNWRIFPSEVSFDRWPRSYRDEYRFKITTWTTPIPKQVTNAIIIEAARIFENKTADRSAFYAILGSYRSMLVPTNFGVTVNYGR